MTKIVDDAEVCPVCKTGHFSLHEEEMAFLQWTDKGLVRCRATIAVAICDACSFKTWDEDAERQLNDAVRREYAKLS
jgi:hypothetical protein